MGFNSAFKGLIQPFPLQRSCRIHLFIYVFIIYFNTLKTKIQRFSPNVTENKLRFPWKDRPVYVAQEDSRYFCRHYTKFINTMCVGSNAKSLALNLAAQTVTIKG
jgi:hypothetical protein